MTHQFTDEQIESALREFLTDDDYRRYVARDVESVAWVRAAHRILEARAERDAHCQRAIDLMARLDAALARVRELEEKLRSCSECGTVADAMYCYACAAARFNY